MTTNHIDQLTEWWETAEQGTARRGDALIGKGHGGHFMIYTADCDEEEPDDAVRILARAPKPKPAWHSAKAVVASTDYCERQVWEWDFLGWNGSAGDVANTEDLRDVTPLIEAKVTDEAMQRVFDALDPAVNKHLDMTKEYEEYVRYILAAALGLDPA